MDVDSRTNHADDYEDFLYFRIKLFKTCFASLMETVFTIRLPLMTRPPIELLSLHTLHLL